ncbi:MAG: DUF4381 domain-containing protein [Methylococcales bacterium]|nr:DUF4381 domain-containing protein [Methylococcales bacterium]
MPPVQDLPLRDIHFPDAISWFPPAFGWWLLIIFVPIISYFLIALLQKIFKKTALKEAQKLLQQLQNNDALSPLEKVSELSVLLRRVSISRDEKLGGLTGRAWLDYLDSTLKDAPFKNGIGRCLVDAPYQKELPTDVDLSALFALVQRWLKAQK